MHSFKDRNGSRWIIDVTVGTIRRVRSELGIDLMGSLDPLPGQPEGTPTLINTICTDPGFAAQIVWVCVEDQAEARKLTGEDFGRRLDGKAMASATTALLRELSDFFTGLGRAELAEAARKHLELAKSLAEMIGAEIAKELPSKSGGGKSTSGRGFWQLIRQALSFLTFGRWGGQGSGPSGIALP